MKVFCDTDVIISSLMSSSGAANLLITQMPDMQRFISKESLEEAHRVCQRMSISESLLDKLVDKYFTVVKDTGSPDKYADYVVDDDDAKIVAGATEAKAIFLVTYNIKHYKTEKIKTGFDIIVLTPATLLQYLRRAN